jgi:hypothetical protein
MRRGWPAVVAFIAWAAGGHAYAAEAIDVAIGGTAVFHHLEASGRHGLAVSGEAVALVWEDNRDGSPRCHLALRADRQTALRPFGFGTGECFEPGIAPLPGGRFLLIWEDAAGVAATWADADGPRAPARLASAGGQGTVAFHATLGAHAVWSAPDGRWRRLWSAPLTITPHGLEAGVIRPVDAREPRDDQAFPSLAAVGAHLVVAWEDRRLGHTVIHTSRSADGRNWSAPARLSRNPTGAQPGNLGRGSGAMRPALAAFGTRLAAVWLDKRDFLSGYDVYAAFSDDEGGTFATELKVQDSFGDDIAQWHAAVAGNAGGELIVAWDDERDGRTDVWFSRLDGEVFGEDFTLAETSGPGQHADPVLALDADGGLHVAWTQRDADGSARLRYLHRPR